MEYGAWMVLATSLMVKVSSRDAGLDVVDTCRVEISNVQEMRVATSLLVGSVISRGVGTSDVS